MLEAVLNIGLCELAEVTARLRGPLDADWDQWRTDCQQRAAELLASTARPALTAIAADRRVTR